MQVKDVMTSVPGHVDVNSSLRDASAIMKTLHLDPIPVVDAGRLVGLLAERDILDLVSHEGVGGGMRPVQDVMTANVPSVRMDYDIREASEVVASSGRVAAVRTLPVVDEHQRLVGLVSASALGVPASALVSGGQRTDTSAAYDDEVDFHTDPVEYMSNESFPASDPGSPPSSLAPSATEQPSSQ